MTLWTQVENELFFFSLMAKETLKSIFPVYKANVES